MGRSGHVSRSPHGERGLKLRAQVIRPYGGQSLSSWRAWIEIVRFAVAHLVAFGRSPHGERGLKYDAQGKFRRGSGSLSSWRAWIEMWRSDSCIGMLVQVALLMESVD